MSDDSAANGDEKLDPLMQEVADNWIEDHWRDRDVRRVLPELRSSGRLRIEEVPWGSFFHAYGPADDVPRLIEGLQDPDAGAVEVLIALLPRAGHASGTIAAILGGSGRRHRPR